MHKTDIQPVLVILMCILALLKEKSDALAKKEEDLTFCKRNWSKLLKQKLYLEKKAEILTAKEDECMLLKEKLEKNNSSFSRKGKRK